MIVTRSARGDRSTALTMPNLRSAFIVSGEPAVAPTKEPDVKPVRPEFEPEREPNTVPHRDPVPEPHVDPCERPGTTCPVRK
jgi:hypothetical protein